ncbi:MAG: SDR family oxidoreductase [Candidatus Aminicenantes bacterium]|nr:SDR family oxidoreductase [Candidatus Aminicenantes bacterium]
MVRSCLVTGGAGFIGSHLAEELVRRGFKVRVLDNFSTGKRENLASFREAVDLIEGDVRDLRTCRSAASGMDYVFHEAALASVPLSVEDPFLTDDINVGGTLNMLWAGKEAGIKRLVFASSTSVYGDNPDLPKDEEMSGVPLSPYALSKWIGEKYCQSFSLIYGIPTVGLRYFNVFGPRQDPQSQYAAAIPIFLSRMLGGGRPVIYGDGEQTRDFVFVRDVVEANLLAAETEGVSGQVFNIASAESLSVNALVRTINDVLGTSIEAVYAPARPGDIRHSAADIRKAEAGLGYRPGRDFRRGLEMTAAWFKEKRRSS